MHKFGLKIVTYVWLVQQKDMHITFKTKERIDWRGNDGVAAFLSVKNLHLAESQLWFKQH